MNHLEEYEKHFALGRDQKSAARTLRAYIKPFADFVEGHTGTSPFNPASINKGVLRAWLLDLPHPRQRAGLKGRPCLVRSAATQNRTIGSVGAFLNWLRKNEMGLSLSRDDIEDVLEPLKVPKRKAEYLRLEQLQALLAALYQHDFQTPRVQPMRRFVLLGLLLGTRPGETLGLSWGSFAPDFKTVKVFASKTGSEREFPVDPALGPFLKLWWAADHAGGPPAPGSRVAVPASKASKPLLNQKRWDRLADLAGLQTTTAKTLRTTAVAYTASALAGVGSEYLLSERFGHNEKTSKDFYRHPLHWVKPGAALAEAMNVTEWLRRFEEEERKSDL